MTDTATAATALFDAPAATPPASDAPPAPPAAAPPATPAEPFLKVNDRTSYATREDALKGWNEAQSRITALSPFEVLMKPTAEGGFGLTADEAVAHLDAYANHLAAQQNAAPATPGSRSDAATVKAAQQGNAAAYESLTPEWKAHVDYLNQLGYAKKDDITGAIKPLQDRVDSLSKASDEAYVQEVNNAVAHGHTLLSEIVKESGVTADEKLLEEIGEVVGARIDRNSYDQNGCIIAGSLADKFIKGSADVRRSIIKEQYGTLSRFSDASKKTADAKYVADKTAAQSQAPRSIPAGGGTPPPPRTGRQSPAERAARVTELIEQSRTA